MPQGEDDVEQRARAFEKGVVVAAGVQRMDTEDLYLQHMRRADGRHVGGDNVDHIPAYEQSRQ